MYAASYRIGASGDASVPYPEVARTPLAEDPRAGYSLYPAHFGTSSEEVNVLLHSDVFDLNPVSADVFDFDPIPDTLPSVVRLLHREALDKLSREEWCSLHSCEWPDDGWTQPAHRWGL